MFRSKIRAKILILFLLVAMLPLIVVQIFWYRAEKNSMLGEAEDHQVILVNNAEESISRFIDDKINLLIIHSQTASIQNLDLVAAKLNVTILQKQDSDIRGVTLLDKSGMAVLSIDQNGNNLPLSDQKDSDEYKVTTFLAGSEYISPVKYNSEQIPYVKIAVPLITYEKRQNL